MANLEDTAVALRKRMEQLGKIYEKYLDNRERFREVVETFDDDLATLHQVGCPGCTVLAFIAQVRHLLQSGLWFTPSPSPFFCLLILNNTIRVHPLIPLISSGL